MSAVMAVINYILNLGPSVMMPIIIFILCMIFRMPLGRSLRAAITIGVGFIAINLVIGLLVNTLGPAAQAMVNNLGIHLDVIDVGWPVAAAISFGTVSVVPWVFILGILLNLLLIVVRFVKTLDIDMWNYWHFIFTAAFVYVITGNFFIALALALLTELFILKLADLSAPIVQDYYGLPGISLPHSSTVDWSPVGWVLNKLLDRIPGLNKLHADTGTIQERFGIVGEPMIIGLVLGLLIGLLAYFPGLSSDFGGSFAKILTTGITLGAVMLVLPRMVAILMEGLVPLSEGAQTFISQRFPGRELYIGLDAAIVIGFANNMTVALLMVPITLILAIVLSFLGLNHVLPFTDLAVLPFLVIWATTWSRGNVIRGVIIATIFMAGILSVGTFLAPMTVVLAKGAHFAIPKGAISISSLDSGAHLISFALVFFFSLQQVGSYGPVFLIWSALWVAFTVACYIAYFLYCRSHVPGIDDKALYVREEVETPENETGVGIEAEGAGGQAIAGQG
ncbi:PTS galactitol transporter subunit IIC [Thermogemmatispora aurantia]|uniref:PTS galactitol transporter subunit IIC n=1 Tax=Thermogemmatispora aurantia TaxID=2045279 RepID=UPI001272DA4F|nr:PTS transporter subunit IIC [Thermogemmatispora aurantia]GER84336.1 PTS galactitol transporter subunit IIC [Thermogemmatispora aurantia]